MTTLRIDDYVFGNVGSNPLDPRNRLNRVRRSDPHFGKSWQEWIDAVSQGAISMMAIKMVFTIQLI